MEQTNPVADATREQLAATEKWREAEVAKVNAAADGARERLKEILEKALSLPTMNGGPPEPGPDDPVGRASTATKPQGGPQRRAGGSVASKATRTSPDAERGRQRVRQILHLAVRAGNAGINGKAIEKATGLTTTKRKPPLAKLIQEGCLTAEGATRNRRYYVTPKGTARAREASDKESSPAARPSTPAKPPKEALRSPRDVGDEEARESEKAMGKVFDATQRGDGSTLQGRICARLEYGEESLASLDSQLLHDSREEIREALGKLLRESLVRPIRRGGALHYRLC